MREIKLPLSVLGLSAYMVALAGWFVIDGGPIAAVASSVMAVGALVSVVGATLEIRSIRQRQHYIGRLLSLLGLGVAMLGVSGSVISDGETMNMGTGGMAAAGALTIIVGAIFGFRHSLRQRD